MLMLFRFALFTETSRAEVVRFVTVWVHFKSQSSGKGLHGHSSSTAKTGPVAAAYRIRLQTSSRVYRLEPAPHCSRLKRNHCRGVRRCDSLP